MHQFEFRPRRHAGFERQHRLADTNKRRLDHEGRDADQVERQNARVESNDAQLALLEAEAEAATAAGQLEDALQVPFAGLEALAAGPAAPTLPPSP